MLVELTKQEIYFLARELTRTSLNSCVAHHLVELVTLQVLHVHSVSVARIVTKHYLQPFLDLRVHLLLSLLIWRAQVLL